LFGLTALDETGDTGTNLPPLIAALDAFSGRDDDARKVDPEHALVLLRKGHVHEQRVDGVERDGVDADEDLVGACGRRGDLSDRDGLCGRVQEEGVDCFRDGHFECLYG